MKITNISRRNAMACIGLLCLCVAAGPRAASAVTYGWSDSDGQSSDATKIAYYSAAQLALFDGDSVKGFATLAGGFSVEDASTATLAYLAAPVGGTILLKDGATLVTSGDLHLDSTAQLSLSGSATIDAGGGAWNLHGDLSLPGQMITLASDLVLDGRSHVVTFSSMTFFALGGNTLTLRNMTIRGLTGSEQFVGMGSLVLENCKIDIGRGTSFTFDNANLAINGDVTVRGGGAFRFSGSGTMSINTFSTLRVETETTFDYDCFTRNQLLMVDSTSGMELDNCVLKAQGMEGLLLVSGRVVVEGEVTADNGSNTSINNGIQLGDGFAGVNVLFKPGGRFKVLGKLRYNRP